jgi:hypothetical protein
LEIYGNMRTLPLTISMSVTLLGGSVRLSHWKERINSIQKKENQLVKASHTHRKKNIINIITKTPLVTTSPAHTPKIQRN